LNHALSLTELLGKIINIKCSHFQHKSTSPPGFKDLAKEQKQTDKIPSKGIEEDKQYQGNSHFGYHASWCKINFRTKLMSKDTFRTKLVLI